MAPEPASVPAVNGAWRLRAAPWRRAWSSRRRFKALALMCGVLAMASAERSALSVASPALIPSLGLDAAAMGWLFAAFGWAYVLAHLPVGMVVARWGVRRTTTASLLAGAALSLAMTAAGAPGLAAVAAPLIGLLRVALGVVQAPIGASSGVVLAAWFPSGERGVAGSVYASMPYLALAVANPLMGWLVEHAGWRTMFAVLALVGAVGAAVWWRHFNLPAADDRLAARERRWLERGGAVAHPHAPEPHPRGAWAAGVASLAPLLADRMMRGLLIAQYAITAITWFFVAWFPLYLVREFGVSVAQAGALSAIPALAGFAGGFTTGLFSDRVLRRTGNLTLARKLPVYLGIGLSVVAMLACLFTRSLPVAVALMALSFFGKQFGTLGWTLVADLAPRNRMAFTGSLVNAVGNLSGVLTPILIGTLVARLGGFDAALVAVAAHGILALASHAWLVGPLRRMPPL